MSEIRTSPRRLVDLHPKWTKGYETGEIVGLEFDCPCGQRPISEGGTCSWGTMYIPIRGEHAWDCSVANPSETASDFATLTLTPSVHAVGHWHGWVQNGDVTSC